MTRVTFTHPIHHIPGTFGTRTSSTRKDRSSDPSNDDRTTFNGAQSLSFENCTVGLLRLAFNTPGARCSSVVECSLIKLIPRGGPTKLILVIRTICYMWDGPYEKCLAE